jgi:hypothetical protein
MITSVPGGSTFMTQIDLLYMISDSIPDSGAAESMNNC